MTIYGYVYLWFDRRKKMYCVGSHYHGARKTYYITSTGWMKSAYKKRPEDFKRRILYRLTVNCKATLQAEEQRWLDMIKPEELSIRYYNLKRTATGGNGGANKGMTHLGGHNRGKPMSDEQKARMKATNADKSRARMLAYLNSRDSWKKVGEVR